MNKLYYFLYSLFIHSINCKYGDVFEGPELEKFLGKLNSIRKDKKLQWDIELRYNVNGISQTCKQRNRLYRDYYSYFELELKGFQHDEEDVANKLIEKYAKEINNKNLEKICCSATPCEKEGDFMYVVCAFPKISDISGSDENTNIDKDQETGGDETDDNKSAEEPGEDKSEEKDADSDEKPGEDKSEEEDVDTDKEPEEETSEEKEAESDGEPEEDTSEEKEAESDGEPEEDTSEENDE